MTALVFRVSTAHPWNITQEFYHLIANLYSHIFDNKKITKNTARSIESLTTVIRNATKAAAFAFKIMSKTTVSWL